MQRPIPLVPMLSLGFLVGTLVLACGVACARHDEVVACGEEMRYDELGFAVVGVEKTKALSHDGRDVRAYGTFWIVDLEIRNHARRVGYAVDAHAPVLVDESGREIPVSRRGQAIVDARRADAIERDWLKPTSVGPGVRLVTPLVFDVPDDAGEARLELVFGGSVGKALDYVFLGDRALALR